MKSQVFFFIFILNFNVLAQVRVDSIINGQTQSSYIDPIENISKDHRYFVKRNCSNSGKEIFRLDYCISLLTDNKLTTSEKEIVAELIATYSEKHESKVSIVDKLIVYQHINKETSNFDDSFFQDELYELVKSNPDNLTTQLDLLNSINVTTEEMTSSFCLFLDSIEVGIATSKDNNPDSPKTQDKIQEFQRTVAAFPKAISFFKMNGINVKTKCEDKSVGDYLDAFEESDLFTSANITEFRALLMPLSKPVTSINCGNNLALFLERSSICDIAKATKYIRDYNSGKNQVHGIDISKNEGGACHFFSTTQTSEKSNAQTTDFEVNYIDTKTKKAIQLNFEKVPTDKLKNLK